MVNVFFVGQRTGPWFLVDTGMYGSAGTIRRAAETRYGVGARPEAIVLTHGHFDHVGSVAELAAEWDVPVYAHYLEMPYLNGKSAYPPPDPTLSGGIMPMLSPLFPRGPIDLGSRLRELAEDDSVPGFAGWRCIFTPGHTPGHISLFRDSDKTLIAGDAIITTRQESLAAIVTQKVELHGPPTYFTPDWDAARDSVQRLAALRPFVIATGHGSPVAGKYAQDALEEMAAAFDQVERPRSGRYSERPAIAGPEGVISVPAPVPNPMMRRAAMIGGGLLLATVAFTMVRRRA